MAAPNNGYHGGGAPPSYRSYYDYLGSSFVHHFGNLPEKPNPERELPRPLDPEKYWDDQGNDQSHTCANLAVNFYNQQEALVKPAGQLFTFFAEVMGHGDHPEDVTMVVQFHTKEDRMTRDNCLYCTGLRHPKEGGFVGDRHAPTDSDSDEEEDSDEEDEEEGSD